MLTIDRRKGQGVYIGGTLVHLIDCDKVINMSYTEIDGKMNELPLGEYIRVNDTDLYAIRIDEYKTFDKTNGSKIRFGFEGLDIVDRQEIRDSDNYRGRYGKDSK